MPAGLDLKIVIIAAGSADAVSQIHKAVQDALAPVSRALLVDCVLSVSRPAVFSRAVCAVVLELDPTAARYPEYCPFLRWCLEQVSARNEFRLCVTASNSRSVDEDAGSSEYQGLLRNLKDTVQNPDGMDLHSIGKQIAEHVGMIEVIIKRAAWRRFQIKVAKFLGLAATLVQIMCVVVGLAVALWLPIWDPGATLGSYADFTAYLTWICEVAGFPFFMLLIYVYTHYGLMLTGMFKDPRGVMYSGAASLMGPLIIFVPVRIHAPVKWIALGALLGCMVESVRRMAVRFRRADIPVGPENVTRIHNRLPVKLRREYTAWLSPWRIPLMPVKSPKVFISYSRVSSWACHVVRELCEKINVVHTEVFADTRISAGENWRRRLNDNLADSTVVLAVIDKITVQRQWPASEIESALRGRRLAGLPEIIVITPSGMAEPTDESWRWLPVYRELLDRNSKGAHSIETMEYDETTAQALSFRFHSAAYSSPSMIPLPLAHLVEGSWKILKLLFFVCSGGCGAAGLIAMLLVLFVFWGFDSGRFLAQRHLCGAAAFAAAAWAAASFRHALGAGFELIGERAHGVMSAHRAGCVFLIVLLGLWFKYLTPAEVGWALFAGYTSYIALDEHWRAKT